MTSANEGWIQLLPHWPHSSSAHHPTTAEPLTHRSSEQQWLDSWRMSTTVISTSKRQHYSVWLHTNDTYWNLYISMCVYIVYIIWSDMIKLIQSSIVIAVPLRVQELQTSVCQEKQYDLYYNIFNISSSSENFYS